MRLLAVSLALLMTVVAAPVRADAPPRLLAVLDFSSGESPGAGVAEHEALLAITDAVRMLVVKQLGDSYKVLTRETMSELVPPERLTCFIDKCAAEIGRMLQVQFVVAGTLRRLGSRQILTVEGYDSSSGRLLGAEQFVAPTVDGLYDAVVGAVSPPFSRWFSDGSAPPAAKDSAVAVPSGSLSETTAPALPVVDQRASWAVRAGLAGAAGIVGLSLEWRPSWFGVVLGSGYMPASLGLTFGPQANAGGPFLDLYATLIGSTPLITLERGGFVYGATGGWDWRLGRWSLKTGLGVAASTVALQGQGGLMADLTIGRVF